MALQNSPSACKVEKTMAWFSIQFAALEPALRVLAACAATNDSNPALKGILVRVARGKVTLIASDGFRLWISSLPAKTKGEGDFVVLPKAFAPFSGLQTPLVAFFAAGQARLSSGPVIVHTMLVRGPYPLRGLIPRASRRDTVVRVDSRTLKQFLESLPAKEAGPTVTIRPGRGELALIVEVGGLAVERTLPAFVKGRTSVVVERRSLLDFASLLPNIELRIASPALPLVVRSDWGTGLLMPVRVDS